ncbi:LytS/YhcK type 5TM receptor domain-containing protein [Marivita hallyeonensis]|uniref:5TMR of 5TMR-LYT n=1 Tax=Marivita hallyeonensis TaxID=996342 RepID=A0A1M5WEN3_9RHOB|nr:LytS/YhcK type 5TM receptor domain-containing protein [Marivita hallyeonensis]SHH85920.1 5TMR of 5TMR-LYT [Marivita hallyeonensis]
MNTVVAAWLDLVAALGLVIALGFAYARLRRLVHMPVVAELSLGASFGFVALLEMHHPIEPFPGMIVDLRNVPIALAGAFLGTRGAILTLIIAMAGRAGIGGVGMWSGLLGMMIALAAGALWQRLHQNEQTRSLRAFVVLAAMMSTHLVAGVILPADIAFWFFTKAAGPVLALNLLTVPFLASALEAEKRSFDTEEALRASAVVDHETGLLPLSALRRECMVRATALADGSFTTALVVVVRPTNVFSIWNTSRMRKRLVAAMRLRLMSELPRCDLATVYGSATLVLPMTQAEVIDVEATKIRVHRAATEDPYALNGAVGHRVNVDVHAIDLMSEIHKLEKLALRRRVGNRIPPNGAVGSNRRIAHHQKEDPRLDHLFAKAEVLMAQNAGAAVKLT